MKPCFSPYNCPHCLLWTSLNTLFPICPSGAHPDPGERRKHGRPTPQNGIPMPSGGTLTAPYCALATTYRACKYTLNRRRPVASGEPEERESRET